MRIHRHPASVFAAITAVAASLVWVGISYSGPSDSATYVGYKKCVRCHLKEYKTWKATKHVHGFEVLKPEDQTNTKCLKCHSTGYGTASGFKSIEDTPALAGTTCEQCHGPGSEHVATDKENVEKMKATINRSPGAACTHCHNPHITREQMLEGAKGSGY